MTSRFIRRRDRDSDWGLISGEIFLVTPVTFL